MNMDDIEESSNVDDRRRNSSSGGRGLPSIGTMFMLWPIVKPLIRSKFGLVIIALGGLAWFSGFNPLSLVGAGGASSSSHVNKVKDDKEAHFIKKVLASTEDVWTKILAQHNIHYTKPVLVLFRGATRSGCGTAKSEMGPFYCPADKKVYLDLGFFDDLARKHNAPGDFAQAYVLAHEVGHHVQDLQGTLNKVQHMKQSWGGRKNSKSNALQVRVELQADCYAGIWAHHAQHQFHILQKGDVAEALNAASSIGDDTLERQATGSVRQIVSLMVLLNSV